MRLYYYTANQWGMKSLWEKRLKIAQYSDLNDPFELLPFDQTDHEARAQNKKAMSQLSHDHGVLCFSKTWRSTLMWAHYGDKHKGLCLGFDIPANENLVKIEYIPERLENPRDFNNPLLKFNQENISKRLNLKHEGWAYEQEHRLRVQLNEKRDGVYYNPFNEGMRLREVIIGARSTLSIVDVMEAVGTTYEHSVKVRVARPAHSTFTICTNARHKVETIPAFDTWG